MNMLDNRESIVSFPERKLFKLKKSLILIRIKRWYSRKYL